MTLLRKRKSQRGAAMAEFTLSLVFLIPFLLGTFVFGFRLIRTTQMQQVVRDVGHMYLRNVDFRNTSMQNIAKTLANGFDLTSTGSSIVILSKIKVVTQADCDAADPAHAGRVPPVACTNRDQGAFMEQLIIGNSSVGQSIFTASTGSTPLQTDKTVTSHDQALTRNARADGFINLLTLSPGEYAYVVEMFNQTPDLNVPGFSGRPEVYARSIF